MPNLVKTHKENTTGKKEPVSFDVVYDAGDGHVFTKDYISGDDAGSPSIILPNEMHNGEEWVHIGWNNSGMTQWAKNASSKETITVTGPSFLYPTYTVAKKIIAFVNGYTTGAYLMGGATYEIELYGAAGDDLIKNNVTLGRGGKGGMTTVRVKVSEKVANAYIYITTGGKAGFNNYKTGSNGGGYGGGATTLAIKSGVVSTLYSEKDAVYLAIAGGGGGAYNGIDGGYGGGSRSGGKYPASQTEGNTRMYGNKSNAEGGGGAGWMGGTGSTYWGDPVQSSGGSGYVGMGTYDNFEIIGGVTTPNVNPDNGYAVIKLINAGKRII